MTTEIFLQLLASGLMYGLVYGLVAVGLTIIFGVMDIVNFSHGEFLMLGMYASFGCFAYFALDPLLALPITAMTLFVLGVLVYQFVIKRIIDAPMVSQLFTTFGLMMLFRGIAQFAWGAERRAIPHSWVSGQLEWAGIHLSLPQLVAAVGAIVITLLLFWFLTRTRLGAALEATAADREAAQLMGIHSQRMFALAWGLGAACAGIAGALLVTFYDFDPEIGANFILIAFVVVNLGGFGSVAGALIAGLLVGMAEVVGGFIAGPQYKMLIVLVLFLTTLMLRPQGLMGKQ